MALEEVIHIIPIFMIGTSWKLQFYASKSEAHYLQVAFIKCQRATKHSLSPAGSMLVRANREIIIIEGNR